MIKVIQDLRDEKKLLRSGRCNMGCSFPMLIYMQAHQLCDTSFRNV